MAASMTPPVAELAVLPLKIAYYCWRWYELQIAVKDENTDGNRMMIMAMERTIAVAARRCARNHRAMRKERRWPWSKADHQLSLLRKREQPTNMRSSTSVYIHTYI